MTTEHDEPVLTIDGDATAEEVAALVVVLQLAAAAAADRDTAQRVQPQWSAPRRGLRGPHIAGPGAWRASGLPR